MRKRALRAFRILGWCAIAVLVLECCARTEDKLRYDAPFFGNYSVDSVYAHDRTGIHGRPNRSYLKWHVNEAGFRGPALRTGTYRIACIGSSETFGLYESPNMEWPRQLESILNQRAGHPLYEVVNTGFPALSIGGSLRHLDSMLAVVKPRIVVIYPSYTPYIKLRKSSAGLTSADVNSRFEWRIRGRVETLLKAQLPQSLQHWARAMMVPLSARKGKQVRRLPDQNVALFRSDLDTLTKKLRAQGVQVVLVTHATRFGKTVSPEDEPFLNDWHTYYPSLLPGGFLDMEQRMGDAVRQEGAALHVPVIDAAQLIPPGSRDFAEFVHFTDAGSTVLATLVADEISREQTPAEAEAALSAASGRHAE